MRKKIFLNYLGQTRLYSLVDFILMLVALNTSSIQLFGAIMLHLAFLAYLENRHNHGNREKVPSWISYTLSIIGVFLYQKIEGVLYLTTSFLYTQKTKSTAPLSPIFRGLQTFFIVGGIVGYERPITYIATALLIIRNLLGDFRDIQKDTKEGVKTLPVKLGLNRDIKHIHLIGTVITSLVWWAISPLSFLWLILVITIEVSTYNLTPR